MHMTIFCSYNLYYNFHNDVKTYRRTFLWDTILVLFVRDKLKSRVCVVQVFFLIFQNHGIFLDLSTVIQSLHFFHAN